MNDKYLENAELPCTQREQERIAIGSLVAGLLVAVLLCGSVLGQTTYSGPVVFKGAGALEVNPSGGAQVGENAYCPAGAGTEKTEGVPTWGASDGVAQLPTACMNSAVSSTPSPGSTYTPATSATLTNVLASANAGPGVNLDGTTGGTHHLSAGDVVQLAAGSSYTGTFTFPNITADGAHWITIKTSGMSNGNFPAEGVRLTPCAAGVPNDATNGRNAPGYPDYPCPNYPTVLTAKIQAPNSANQPAITFASGANHYRFIGIEFAKYPGLAASQIITLSADGTTMGANHLIFDRCLIHGEPWTMAATAGTETQGGIKANNSQWVAEINGWNYDTYCDSSCTDSQGFQAGTGAYQDGPFKVYNNLLASAGENFMLGGGGQGIGTPNTQNFEVRDNFLMQPLTWMVPVETCGNAGFYPVVHKNLGEFKNGVLTLIEGNVFENSWQGCQSDQQGYALLLDPKNQNNKAAMSVSFDGSATVTRVSGGNFKHTCGNDPNCSPADATNCPPGGCILEINDTGRSDNGAQYRYCNGTNGCAQAGDLVNTATLTTPVAAGAASTYTCVPGDCPSCRVENVTVRNNEIYNAINGFEIVTVKSAHCLDESAGMDRVSVHDNLIHGLSRQMTNGSGYYQQSSAFVVDNGQAGAVNNSIQIAHNTVAIEEGNTNGFGGLGQQTDHTDLGYMHDLTFTDNVANAPWIISHSNGSIVNGGLATNWQTQSCKPYYPNDAGNDVLNGIVQNGTGANTVFTFSPSLGAYIVTVNGVPKTITGQAGTQFTLTTSTNAGDSISVRDTNTCAWTFRGNLLGKNLAGSGKDYSPYPDGTVNGNADNNAHCGLAQNLTCILDESQANAFTSQFVSFGTGRAGNFALAPASAYVGSATDAASRPATGKNPGADITTLGQLTAGVAGAVYYPALSVTSTTLPSGTVGAAYQYDLVASAGASPFKRWWVETDSTKCGGNCGTFPSAQGFMLMRDGTINGPIVVISVQRSLTSCGAAGTVACSTVSLKSQPDTGSPAVGQVMVLAGFVDGSGTKAHDSTFNGTCTVRIVSGADISCDQTGTGYDTIAKHTQSSTNGLGNASFAPTASGSFGFWVGVADGAFQKAWGQVGVGVQ